MFFIQVYWTHTWQEISEPKLVDKGVQIFIKDTSKKKKLGLFGIADQSKIILIPDYNIRQVSYIIEKNISIYFYI